MPNVFAQRWSSEAYAGPSSSKRLAVCVAIRCSVALRSGFVLLTSAAECCRLITVCADVTKAISMSAALRLSATHESTSSVLPAAAAGVAAAAAAAAAAACACSLVVSSALNSSSLGSEISVDSTAAAALLLSTDIFLRCDEILSATI